LVKKGIPAILIPGILFAGIYGIKSISKINNYYQSEKMFPKSGIVAEVEDGDTFELATGHKVRMIGINAPDRGKEDYEESKGVIEALKNKKVWLEYDRYQDDKYGRILAWVWIGCETDNPKMLPADYMHLSGNESREYVTKNPEGCEKGELLNKRMILNGLAETVNYEKRGRLKYKLD